MCECMSIWACMCKCSQVHGDYVSVSALCVGAHSQSAYLYVCVCLCVRVCKYKHSAFKWVWVSTYTEPVSAYACMSSCFLWVNYLDSMRLFAASAYLNNCLLASLVYLGRTNLTGMSFMISRYKAWDISFAHWLGKTGSRPLSDTLRSNNQRLKESNGTSMS